MPQSGPEGAAAAPVVIVAVNVDINFTSGIGIGAMYAFLSESFPKAVRSSGLAILYALSVTIFGGTTQVEARMTTWLQEAYELSDVPAARVETKRSRSKRGAPMPAQPKARSAGRATPDTTYERAAP